MAVQMQRVLSSHVLEIGYDDELRELHVRYLPTVANPRGTQGVYQDVDPDTAESVLSSPSIGSALYSQVKGFFSWREG